MNGEMQAPDELPALKFYRRKDHNPIRDWVHCVGLKYQREYHYTKHKRLSNMVLMIPDPANPHDENAIACYVTKTLEDQSYTWVRAGYIARTQTDWFKDRSVIYEGQIEMKNQDYFTVSHHNVRLI